MLKTDDQENTYKAASTFKGGKNVQFFDAANKVGDMAAKRLNPKGEKAWDIYMFTKSPLPTFLHGLFTGIKSSFCRNCLSTY